MPPNQETPDRCLLEQVAHWYANGVMPVTDEFYRLATLDQNLDQEKLRELFLHLLHCDCEPQASIALMIYHPVTQGDIERSCTPETVGEEMWPWRSQTRSIGLSECNLSQIDFAFSTIYSISNFDLTFDEIQEIQNQINIIQSEYKDPHICKVLVDVTLNFAKLRNYVDQCTDAEATRETHILAERECENWLAGLMQELDKPKDAKDHYYRQALDKQFAVSRRGFNRAWDKAKERSGNSKWSDPGRKS